jgi:hypothetical protein
MTKPAMTRAAMVPCEITVTPGEAAALCSTIWVGWVPVGMSNARWTCAWLPGLISVQTY